MYVKEFRPANEPRRRRARLAVVLFAVAALAGVRLVVAQASPVSVAGFDQSGLEVVTLASFEAGGATTFYSAPGSRWGASGSLVEGDADLDANSTIVRVMSPNQDGSLLRLNDDGPLALREFFGASGAGSDLTVWFRSEGGTTSFAASDVKMVGSSYVNFHVPTSGQGILRGIGSGDRFVLAITRPAPDPEPTAEPSQEPTPTPTPGITPVPEPSDGDLPSSTDTTAWLCWTSPCAARAARARAGGCGTPTGSPPT